MKKRHIDTFNTYVKWKRDVATINPTPTPLLEQGKDDPIRVFIDLDSRGKTTLKPNNPQLLADSLDGKKLLNLQIKEWAEGFYDCGAESWVIEAKGSFPWLPDWVWNAVREQAYRKASEPV